MAIVNVENFTHLSYANHMYDISATDYYTPGQLSSSLFPENVVFPGFLDFKYFRQVFFILQLIISYY